MSAGTDRPDPSARHRILVALLGAYVDEELGGDDRRELDAHLPECEECRRELQIHRALKARLLAEERAVPPAAALDRLEAHLRALAHGPTRRRAELRHPERDMALRAGLRAPAIVSWGGWLAAAGLGALLVFGPHHASTGNMGMSMGPTAPVALDSVPEPIATAALEDFRRINASELPQGPHLASVQAQVPFSVPALHSSHMRLIGSWTAEIGGERAAVLAYRCHDRLVVQYVVAEHVFFRPPRVRSAIAAAGLYAAGEGKTHAVGWPGTDSGSFLVGDFTPAELAAMRL